MDKEERLLAEVHDEFGVIRVLEVGDYRFLEFGEAIEQSCVFTADPYWRRCAIRSRKPRCFLAWGPGPWFRPV
jgi:hypothetical protein